MTTKYSTGIAKGTNGFEAAKDAAQQAMNTLGSDPDMAFVFASLDYHLDEVCSGLKEVIGDTPMVGASSAGEFTERGGMNGSVAVSLIKSDSHKFFITSADDLKENAYEKVRECTSKLPVSIEGFEHQSAIVLHDGLIGKGEKIISELKAALPHSVTFAGGAAGDDLKFQKTYVIQNHKVMNNALVVVFISSKEKVGLGVKHGHVPVSGELEVTKAKENVLYRINGKPAWDVWREQLKDFVKDHEGIDVYDLHGASEIGSFLLKYELGLSMGNNQYKVRVPLSVSEDGGMHFAVEIFEGSRFNIMHSVKENQIESARNAAEEAKSDLGDKKIGAVFIFDCVCRGLILGDDFYEAVQGIKHVIGDVPLIGFETYGEICMNENNISSGFHNTTSVVMLLPD